MRNVLELKIEAHVPPETTLQKEKKNMKNRHTQRNWLKLGLVLGIMQAKCHVMPNARKYSVANPP